MSTVHMVPSFALQPLDSTHLNRLRQDVGVILPRYLTQLLLYALHTRIPGVPTPAHENGAVGCTRR